MNLRSNSLRVGFGVCILALLSVGLGACAAQPNAGIACGWPIKGGKDVVNVAYPDSGATYFTTKYTLLPGQRLILKGTYAEARYMSLITYDIKGDVVDSLADVKINPDPGSKNPFVDETASQDPLQRRWTVNISPDIFAGSGQLTNQMSAASLGSVMMRVYVPTNPLPAGGGEQAFGSPLPEMTVLTAGGVATPIATCPIQAADPEAAKLVSLFGPPTNESPSNPVAFKRPISTSSLYPNPDNTYLSSLLRYQAGTVLVVRGKAPTTPNTQAGESAATPSQLRYWSLCTNEYIKPYPVTDCVFDAEVPVDGSGYYTIVVSTPADRPANATQANGVAWLDWGSRSVDLLLLFRNMLPATSFTQSAFSVSPGQLATTTMGEYAPLEATCTTATFESGGSAGCGL